MQRLDGQTGAVSWEYYSDDGSLSEVAVHPDGTVFVTDHDYGVTTSLVALDGETGALQRWPLPWQDSQARASGPIVPADGRVVVLSNPQDGSCTSLDLVELASPTAGGLTVTEVTLAAPDCYFYPDEYRLLPDGADGLLIAQQHDGASVRRLGADGLVSDRTDLVPPLAGLPVIEAEYVVGDTVAHALVKQWTGSVTDQYVTSHVEFDPATLTVDRTTDLGADPYVRLRFLDSADAVHYSGPPGGAARPLGGEVGPHDTQAAAGLWAALGSGPALIEGPAFDVASASGFAFGGAQSANVPDNWCPPTRIGPESQYPLVREPIAFLLNPTGLLSDEIGLFRSAAEEWEVAVRRHAPAVRMSVSTTTPGQGRLVEVFIDPTFIPDPPPGTEESLRALTDRGPTDNPWTIRLRADFAAINGQRNLGWLRRLFLHEIGHIVGLDHVRCKDVAPSKRTVMVQGWVEGEGWATSLTENDRWGLRVHYGVPR